VSALAGAWRFGSVQDRVGGQAGGEGDVGGQMAPGRPAVGGVAHHVDGAPVQRGGEEVDQGAGLLGLGGAGLGDVQADRTGRQTWRARKGTAATIPTITKQLPRPMPSRPLAEPSCWYLAPWTFLP